MHYYIFSFHKKIKLVRLDQLKSRLDRVNIQADNDNYLDIPFFILVKVERTKTLSQNTPLITYSENLVEEPNPQ